LAAGLLLAAGIVNSAFGADQATPQGSENAFAQDRRIGRGVNILGYDPFWRSRDRARFQERHFQLIKEAGFDSVRIVLYPFRDGQADSQHRLSTGWFQAADWAVEHALANHLTVILDFHEYETMGRDPEGNKQRFLAMWQQIAQHFRTAPSSVIFEALNEPNKKLTPALWNNYLREALAVIRQSNPGRTLIVGPASWNNINALDQLELPENDRNLIVTVHYYNPFPFTHQGASWAGMKDKVGVSWNGTPEERQAVARDLDRAQTWAAQHRRPIFLGEFGAYEPGDLAARVRWTACVAREAEKRQWSWAYWQFEGSFFVYDIKRQEWVTPIRDALIPPPTNRPALAVPQR
jgi:endoglucanase